MIPTILVAFNRPDKLAVVIDALSRQTVKPPLIIAYCDGQRNPSETHLVQKCISLVEKIGFTRVQIVKRLENMGCASNIMYGVKAALDEFKMVTVLEDDTVPEYSWYESMVAMLHHYEQYDHIKAVGGFPSILHGALDGYPHDAIISPRFSCWGWGTWSSKWQPVYGEWLFYRQNGTTPWPYSTVSDVAGPDIVQALMNAPGGSLWDAMVAGSFVRYGWYQAISRWYLVNNIGIDSHMSASKIAMMAVHNKMVNKVPRNLPPPAYDDAVGVAVRDYVKAFG